MSTPNTLNTKEGCLQAANKWLDKAVQLEANKKEPKFVELAFKNAVKYEAAAFDGRP